MGVETVMLASAATFAVTVVDQAAQPMTTLDPDMGAAVHRAMEGIGIDVRTGTAVTDLGDDYVELVKSRAYGDAGVAARVEPFLYAMDREMKQADVIVSRAGSTSIAEPSASAAQRSSTPRANFKPLKKWCRPRR